MFPMGPEPQFPYPETTGEVHLIFMDSFFSNFNDPCGSSGRQGLVCGISFCGSIVRSPQGPV